MTHALRFLHGVEIPTHICIKCFLETVLLCLCNAGAFSSKIKVFTLAVLPDRVPPLVCLNFTQGATFLYQLIIFVHLSHVHIPLQSLTSFVYLIFILMCWYSYWCAAHWLWYSYWCAAHWLWIYREQNWSCLHDELTTGTKSCSLYCKERAFPSPNPFCPI